MKAALIGAAMVATVALAGSANAQVANATFTPNANGNSPAPTAGYTVIQSFDACATGANTGCASMSGNYHILNGNQSGSGTIPFGNDTTNYLSVLASDNNPVATFTFSTPVSSVQFDWGTAASTDTLTILTQNISTGVAGTAYTYTVPNSGSGFNGTTLGANYNLDGLFQATASAGYVITGLSFAAAQNSFEVENIAVATPEPATWGMMILGFGLVGAGLRSRRRNGTLAVA